MTRVIRSPVSGQKLSGVEPPKTLAGLSDPAAVRAALQEFDSLGRNAFLERYGFRKARTYFLVEKGRSYDSKAIAGAAYGYQHPERGPLTSGDFIGGEATVRPKLQSLGFSVIAVGEPSAITEPGKTAQLLTTGDVYSRETLATMFKITDATLNTGVFQPSGSSSIWLFVTRDKTSDRTQYADQLEGDLLHWEGQTSGRTDRRIINHEADGNELLVFFRDSKRQHPNAGFRFEGQFHYLTHAEGSPSRFVLQRNDAVGGEIADAAMEPFDPANVEDGRKKVLAMVARRQGQPAFRRALMKAYGGRCAITGCAVEAVLEAAHISPYRGPETNHVTNGLLLRADLHTLFDLKLLTVTAENRVSVATRLLGSTYAQLHDEKLRLPARTQDQPSSKALDQHRMDA